MNRSSLIHSPDSAKLLRQVAPPSHSATQRAPIRERQAVRLIAPQGGTARLLNRSSLIHSPDSAKSLRQVAPPSRSATQRAPIRERQAVRLIAPRGETARPSNRSSLIHSPSSAKRLRQTTPPNCSAKLLRQVRSAKSGPPTDTASPIPMSGPAKLIALDHNPAGIWTRMSPNRFPSVNRLGGGLAVHDLQPADSPFPPRPVVPAHPIDLYPEPQAQHIAVPRRSTPVFQITCSKREGAPDPGGD